MRTGVMCPKGIICQYYNRYRCLDFINVTDVTIRPVTDVTSNSSNLLTSVSDGKICKRMHEKIQD